MNELQRAFVMVAAATVVLYLAVGGLTVFILVDTSHRQARLARLTRNTTESLCALRHDHERRITAAEHYLRTTPHAIPGITPAQIRQGIRDEQQTVRALSHLNCHH